MSQSKQTITTKVSAEVVERLDTLAERIGWTRSDLMAHCIEYGLRDGEKYAERLSSPIIGQLMRVVFHLDSADPQQVAEFESMLKAVKSSKPRLKGVTE